MTERAFVVGPQSLTRRELEVAGLASRGMTVRDIAAALIVGVRTVDFHLSNVYAKLGVASKRELARRAAEFDLT